MVERTVTIAGAAGLHARPARLFVNAAKDLPVQVTVEVDGKKPARADSILAVLALGAEQGTAVTLTASDGPEGIAAVDELAALLASDLDAPTEDEAPAEHAPEGGAPDG